MTPEERIEELAEQAFQKQKGAATGGDIITAIADAIRAAVAEEREACEGVAKTIATELRKDRDQFASEGDEESAGNIESCATVADDVIAGIRARGQ